MELGETDIIDAKHDGYNPDGHQRRYKLSGSCLDITDVIFTDNEWSVAFVIASELAKKMKELSVDEFSLGIVTLKTESKTEIDCQLLPTDVSTRYGVKYKSKKIVVRGKGSATLNTRIMW